MKNKIRKAIVKILDWLCAGNAYTTGGEEMLKWYLDSHQ